jgi:hypothetical protein
MWFVMQSIKSAVLTALQTSSTLATLLGTGQRIYFQYPPSFTNLPLLSYFEVDNFGNLYADDQEIGSEMLYQIDVWSKASTTAIAEEIDAIMTGLDFTRSSANDLYEVQDKIFHKAMTYRLDYSDPSF